MRDRKELLESAYHMLEVSYKNQNFLLMYGYLSIICNYNLEKRDFVFHCLYLLAKHNYHEEAKYLLSNINLVLRKERKYIEIIKNAIRNQETYCALTEEQKKEYEKAIYYGSLTYQNQDYDIAYAYFIRGFEVTNHPIFKYYIGKVLYKKKEFLAARNYFLQYIEKGEEKGAKAYLYLASIAFEETGKSHEAYKYKKEFEVFNKFLFNNFEFKYFEPFEPYEENEESLILKNK